MADFKQILFFRDAPLLLTLWLGFGGWTISHLAGRLTESPLLECISHEAEPTEMERANPKLYPPDAPDDAAPVHKRVFEITNLSRTHRFSEITFMLNLPAEKKAGQIRGAWTDYRRPALPRNGQGIDPAEKSQPAQASGRWAWYPIREIQPEWTIDLVCWHTGDTAPELGFLTRGAEPVRLIGPGLTAWVIRSESGILASLFGGWAAGLLAYLFFIGKSKTATP